MAQMCDVCWSDEGSPTDYDEELVLLLEEMDDDLDEAANLMWQGVIIGDFNFEDEHIESLEAETVLARKLKAALLAVPLSTRQASMARMEGWI